ncbi:MAG TPA: biopolymer transporter ExbD [Thermoanaerobaculia bacterium]|jgi:biopolymer transport protein ExbD|nr:biopolymer transporter ExbD [Thermoanaerobaculia bacterium]
MNVPRSQAAAAVRSEINVTPLVDVCLVLLIIFMVVTPLLGHEVPVQLPETQKPGTVRESERQITVTIQADGAVWVNALPVPREHLKAKLADLNTDEGRPVVVEADRSLRYGEVRSVLEIVQDAGFRNVGLIAERRSG